jgi:CMP/dCMP kinase
MERKHIITVSGLPGSGKSSSAKLLAERLHYTHFSAGDLMRLIGSQKGLTIDETNIVAESDPSFDKQVDEAVHDMGKKDHLVIDSRIAFHWIPESFKVFLKIDPHIAAERTFAQIKNEGRFAQPDASSSEEVYHKLVLRMERERKRYATRYENLDFDDEAHYDLVLDTGLHPLDTMVSLIADKYREWQPN